LIYNVHGKKKFLMESCLSGLSERPPSKSFPNNLKKSFSHFMSIERALKVECQRSFSSSTIAKLE